MTKANKTNLQRPYPFETLHPTQLAWLAGLLQAEADFTTDKKIRSKSGDPDYIPPPSVPRVKLEMVEKDLMDYVGKLVGQNVVTQKRKTTANKEVYRISMEAREKNRTFFKSYFTLYYWRKKPFKNSCNFNNLR